MGFAEFRTPMESRTRSVSSGLGSSSGLRRETLKSSPFCPHSSTKLAQSIIKDHMVSHYKKVYSAKAAIDTSVPKSLLQSVKYKDQIRKERLRKGLRPKSALSFSQRNSRTSCSTAQSQLSVQYDDSPYLCSRSSIVSSSRFTTSFNTKDVVYPSKKVSACDSRLSSEMKYRSQEGFQRKHSTFSLENLGNQACYKTFQDAVKKTYSGDLLQKHSQHFTQEKPFTPKTLKSDKSSYLSKYRYYRAPQVKSSQDGNNSGQMQQDTCEISTQNKETTQELDEPPQEYPAEDEWLEDQVRFLSPSRQENRKTKREPYLSSSRVFVEDMPSPIRSRKSAEEEELMYLEFISAVTEDILSKGHISDSIINRVMNRHIDMNLHRLDEGKMRHLLDVLHKEFEQPTSINSSSTEPIKRDNYLLDSVFSHLESEWEQVKTERESDPQSHVSPINNHDSTEYDDPLLVSTLLKSPGRASFSTKMDEKQGGDDNDEDGVVSTLISENALNNKDNTPENFHQIDSTAINSPEENYMQTTTDGDQKQADIHIDGHSNELEDLGKTLSEVLRVSSNAQSDNVETAKGPPTDSVASVSDDDF